MATFDGTDDYFDSREAIELIAELEVTPKEHRHADDQAQLDALIALRDEAEGNIADWEYGEIFISAFSFTDHMMEILNDVGYIPADLPSWIVIDRDKTADNMKIDYTEFEFRGTTYYAR